MAETEKAAGAALTMTPPEVRDQGNSPTRELSPYGRGWESCTAAGWLGVIPVDSVEANPDGKGKQDPPSGVTGKKNWGRYPTAEQMRAWAADPSRWGNIAIRLPDTVIGIDVDGYGSKQGAVTLAKITAETGVDLPATWTSTSRDDGVSGIHLFRVPAGLAWPSELEHSGTKDVEIIRHGHRYVIVRPSVHHEGRIYRWIDPAGVESIRVPGEDELAELPPEWVDYLTGGKTADPTPAEPVDLGEAMAWLTDGEPCPAVAKALERYTGGSRHDTVRDLQVALLRLGEQGHQGTRAAWDTLEARFLDDVTGDGSRSPG